jgi:hypothetical protein
MTEIRPTRTIAEESIESSARHNVLDYDHVENLAAVATPSVRNLTRFRANGAVTITNFLHGAPGHIIHILGDGLTTIAHNATIQRTLERADILEDDMVYSFMYDGGVWYEFVDRYGVVARLNGGTSTGVRKRINFISTAHIDISVVDDPGSDEIDVTFTYVP